MNSCPPSNSKRLSDVSMLSATSEMQKCMERKKFRQKHDNIQDRFGDRWNPNLQRDMSDGLVACNYPIAECCAISDTVSSVLSDDVPFDIKNSKISFKAGEERTLGLLQTLSANRSQESSDEEYAVLKGSHVARKVLLATGITAGENTIRSDAITSNVQKCGRKVKDKQSVSGNINSSARNKRNKINFKNTISVDDVMMSDEESYIHQLSHLKKDNNWESSSEMNEECLYGFPRKGKTTKFKEPAVSDLEPDYVNLKHQIENIEANLTIDAIKQGEGLLLERCAELRDQLVKERALTCKLITQKTIAEQRTKIAESLLDNQQEWKNKTVEDVEIARKNIKQISDVYSEVISQMKNEKKLNNSLQQKVQRDRKKRKRFKDDILELTHKIDQLNNCRMCLEGEKNELKSDLKHQEDGMQQCRSENMDLVKKIQKEKQTKQKAIDESNEKITTLKEKMDEGKCRMKIRYEDLKTKIDELQDQVKSEKAQHEITKNAYSILYNDWNKLYEKLSEIRTAIMSVSNSSSTWIDDTKLSISD